MRWTRIIEGIELPRGVYLVKRGERYEVFHHLSHSKDLTSAKSRLWSKDGCDWTHYVLVKALSRKRKST